MSRVAKKIIARLALLGFTPTDSMERTFAGHRMRADWCPSWKIQGRFFEGSFPSYIQGMDSMTDLMQIPICHWWIGRPLRSSQGWSIEGRSIPQPPPFGLKEWPVATCCK